MKKECDDWYGRNLDAKEREDSLKCINADKRLALVEEGLQEQSKELAETNKKLIELKQEQSNPVSTSMRGKYWLTCVWSGVNTDYNVFHQG